MDEQGSFEMDTKVEYRFASKKDYEDKIREVLVARDSVRKERRELLEEEYDALVDEYLRFCSIDG